MPRCRGGRPPSFPRAVPIPPPCFLPTPAISPHRGTAFMIQFDAEDNSIKVAPSGAGVARPSAADGASF
eukprot:scaffold25527_cov31-Tisochrysis_lutea.AAC.4